jgi:subtilisin-like proprotein convertase family protein
MLCFLAAVYFWHLGDEWAAQKAATPAPNGTNQLHPKGAATPAGHSRVVPASKPLHLLSQAGLINSPPIPASAKTNSVTSRTAYRLTNTKAPLSRLIHSDKAVLLENAMIDTEKGGAPKIPDSLRSHGDPGSYIVQARVALNDDFRALLKNAGAAVVSYVPNNAYLVRASEAIAQQLQSDPQTQTVLAYEPYYKLKPSLLKLAVEQQPLPDNALLNVLVFPDARGTAQEGLEKLGAVVIGENRSPFGPILVVRPPTTSLPAIAGLSAVQEVEPVRPRRVANDLSRVTLGISADTVTNSNYENLTGSGVLVTVSDTGIDTAHPDLQGRVRSDSPVSGFDTNGHGTHVAGIIAGSGLQSITVTNAEGSINPGRGKQYRGKAPSASLFSMQFTKPDWYLQETAASADALVSNNSWTYGVADYDLAAAGYDAAVRDSLPTVTGSQALIYVFPSGNEGGANTIDLGNDGGTGGNADTVESPGTAKNVITVGAVEQLRDITNSTVVCDPIFGCVTNQPWLPSTDSSNQVAGFSGRGNVGIGVEGDFGRFKPDLVAPGTFVVSTRSGQWDQAAYYNPTNSTVDSHQFFTLPPFTNFLSFIFVPQNTVQLIVSATAIAPSVPLPITVSVEGGTSVTRNNQVTIPPDAALDPLDSFWSISISNNTGQTVSYNWQTTLVTTNNQGDFLQVLKGMNDSLGNFYRYESGTSLAAASVSGVLALMEEFFAARMRVTNSPALMKAMLINGARSVGGPYDFQVRNAINYQGWGEVFLPTSLPGTLSNLSSVVGSHAPMFLFDQNPAASLASGQRHTRFFSLSSDGQTQPLRVTLAWTDPPGNPAASVKLVNDLDLVVTNVDTGDVYFGNDILAGNEFNFAWDTNAFPQIDVINNVENVFIKQPAGTNFSVTVIGHHVNVNAVTANPNDVAQDYALVVSSGDGAFGDALTLTTDPGRSLTFTQPNVLFVTNTFPNDPENPVSGGLLLHQHVGANTPLLGTNTVSLSNVANAQITIGMTNQWHFYVLSNQFNFTNASFVVFMPPNEAVPRMGVTNVDDVNNATRPEADVDLYVSRDPGLTNLSPAAIAGAAKSLNRGGTEFIVKNDAQPGLYYVGIKAEDQQAAEFSFLGIFSLLPPSSTDNKGNVYMRGLPVPAIIPPGVPPKPQAALVLGIDSTQIHVRRVVVTNTFTHSLPGNLLGNLSHNTKFVVLNNHTCALDASGNCFTNRHDYIYEDNGEHDVPGSRPSDGPGNLKDFIGEEGLGVWLLSMVNTFPNGTGEVDRLTIKLEPQNLGTNGTLVDLPPFSWFYDSIDVPDDVTNLTVCVSGNTAPIDLYVSRQGPPTTTFFEYHLQANAPGGCLPVTILDKPPLTAGRYYVGVYNGNFSVQHIRVTAELFRNPFAIASSVTCGAGGPVAILDDAVTYAYLTNLNHMDISSVDVGLLIRDPRISDLAITLISPNGTRVLLFENRGAASPGGLGTFNSITNSSGAPSFGSPSLVAFYTNNFDAIPTGPYGLGTTFNGWKVLTNSVTVYPELPAPWLSNNVVILSGGVISNALPTTNSTQYTLSFEVAHTPYLVGTVAWWPFEGDGSDIFGGFNGILLGNVEFTPLGEVNRAFVGDGVAARMIVPRAPALDLGRGSGFSVEGWINPANVATPGPLVEWNNAGSANGQGVQVWLDSPYGTNGGPGAISAVLWDQNSQAHIVDTSRGVITNSGWQHIALTYDAKTFAARLYTNGELAVVKVLAATNFIPRTSGDLYFGYHPAVAPDFIAFNGGLDEFGLYNRPLSDCELREIFGAGAAGKSSSKALSCPASGSIQLLTSLGPVNTNFAAGLNWTTNIISFPTLPPGPGRNATPIIVTSLDPNLTVDNFVLSSIITNSIDGLMHLTDDTNVASVPIKFAQAPYALSNFPPTLIFSNDFESVVPGLYNTNSTLSGAANAPGIGVRNWTVVNGRVTVLSNPLLDAMGSNSVALGSGGVQCVLPTTPGEHYRLTYSLRGPGMVSWWNGDIEPLSHRAWDLIGGNHGALLFGATNSPAGFVDFGGDTTTLSLPGVIDAQNNLVSKIELADPANLRLTNSFTIEGWIKPASVANFVSEQTEQILFRGDSRRCFDPYYFGLERVTPTTMDLVFHIEDGASRDCGIILESAGQPVQVGQWQHVAAVFESNVFWATNAPWPTNELRLYVNGRQLTPTNGEVFLEDPRSVSFVNSGFTGRFPFGDLDPAFSPGVSIGNRSRTDNSEPFHGLIDELSVYGRALTGPEIAAIAAAGVNGKADPTMPPAQGLAKVEVLINNVQVGEGFGDNSQWTTHTVDFTADLTNVVLTVQSLLPGTIIDGITLTRLPAELSYLPEEPLDVLNGEDGYGIWTLEIWDDRVGANVAPGSASLLNWQMNFVCQPSSPLSATHLQHGIIYTNTLVAGGSLNLVVDVPLWATNATNVLLGATDKSQGTPLSVGVLWDLFNQAPISTANAIVWPPNNTGSQVLSGATTPQEIIPGQPYYLTIINPNAVPVTFAYGVWFDVSTLTNCAPYSSLVSKAGIPHYFQFDVPNSVAARGAVPQAVSFYLTGVPNSSVGLSSNVTIVLSEHLPLPDLSHYDYISSNPGTNNDVIMVVTNTTPFPIQTNRWYVGVFNQADTSVPVSVQACVSDVYPTIIPLKDGVPFVASLTNAFVAPPGPPRTFFFRFQVTNAVDGVLFEMYNLSGDADLVLERDVPPTMAPYYDGSFQKPWINLLHSNFEGTNWEQIVLRVTPEVPSLVGDWYIGVYNNESRNVAYSLRGVTSQGGLLLSIQEPPVPTLSTLANGSVLLSWYTIVGEYYQVQSSLPRPLDWQPVPGGLIRATTPETTLIVPGSAGSLIIYRIIHLSSLNLPQAPLKIQLWTNNQIKLSWSSAFPNAILQFADSPSGPWFNANLPVTFSGGQFVVFDAIGAIPRYYRLLQ